MLENQSPIVRRLVMFWLPIMVVIGVFLYLSQTHYDAQKEAQYGLQRLNFWRRQAGLPVLERQAALEQAAQKHAQYLTHNPDGHDERNRSNPHFTGADPQERANAAGYPAAVSENLPSTIGFRCSIPTKMKQAWRGCVAKTVRLCWNQVAVKSVNYVNKIIRHKPNIF